MLLTPSFKKYSLLCCLALGLTRAGAQTNGLEIIGYNNNFDPTIIRDLATSPYTTFIDGFLIPTANSTGANPGLVFDNYRGTADESQVSASRVGAYTAAQDAGKKVLLSFGGFGVDSSTYQTFAATPQATQTLANILAAYVTAGSSYFNAVTQQTVPISTHNPAGGAFRGYSGIDLDFEDTQSFLATGTYNGVNFISQLTIDLRAALGNNYLITQAPQTPYLDPAFANGPSSQYANGAYRAVFANNYNTANPTATEAGLKTNWLNVQFYNNPGYDGDGTVSGVVQAFERLVTANPAISAKKFVLTLPLGQRNANDNNQFTSAQITDIVSQIDAFLKARGDGGIAGVAGFQLSNFDLTQAQAEAADLAFANAILAGVVPEPSTWALALCGTVALGWTLRRRRVSSARL